MQLEFDNDGYPLPSQDLLFHYTRRETALEKILEQGQLKLSPPMESNDPLESAGFGLILSRFQIQLADIEASSAAEQLIVERARLACFTRDAAEPAKYEDWGERIANRGWARDRMWAQYAQAHRGICVLFDRSRLEDIIRAALRPRSVFWASPVEYSDKSLPLNRGRNLNPDEWSGPTLEEKALAFANARIAEHYGRKRTDWERENEYRIVTIQPGPEPPIETFHVRDAIRGFIVGHSFDDAYEATVRDLSDRLGVPVLKHQYYSSPHLSLYHRNKGARLRFQGGHVYEPQRGIERVRSTRGKRVPDE